MNKIIKNGIVLFLTTTILFPFGKVFAMETDYVDNVKITKKTMPEEWLNTLLSWFTEATDDSTCMELLKLKANPTGTDCSQDMPLFKALDVTHKHSCYRAWNIFQKQLENANNINVQDKNGNTLLNSACKYYDSSAVEHILKKPKCDPTIVDDHGNSPLTNAIFNHTNWIFNNPNGMLESQKNLVKLLIEKDKTSQKNLFEKVENYWRLLAAIGCFKRKCKNLNVSPKNKSEIEKLIVLSIKTYGK